MDYTIRPLVAKDLGIYKPMRLGALKTDPGVFRRSFGEEDAMPESFWSERIANPGERSLAYSMIWKTLLASPP